MLTKPFSRRRFMHGASALAAANVGGLATALHSFPAHAADTSGYKALVCVFLLGGMDNYDTLLPFDQPSYDTLAAIRDPLFQIYANQPGGSSRDRSRLLPLNPDNAADFGGRQFALPEDLTGIHSLFENGDAAIIGNVGPLIVPTTAAQFEAESVVLPTRLFSHNDQQSTWISSQTEGATTGWGGKFLDPTLVGGDAPADQFAGITTLGNQLFITGDNTLPYQASVGGATEIQALQFFEDGRGDPDGEMVYQSIRNHFTAAGFAGSNLIERDFAAAAASSVETNEAFNAALDGAPEITTSFPGSFLSSQLRTVAQTIAARNVLLSNRQVFICAIGGFDTHSNQVNDLPGLHREIDGAVTAFFSAMQELGVSNDVTLFTASDFGRTLFINGDGTDHGWGAHHFVVGGAVNGRQIYGDVPLADFDHGQDAGGGRLVPTTAVEQLAAPLGTWFGLTEPELMAALPNLANFPGPRLGFV